MHNIKKIVDFIQQFDYVMKITKALLAGFDTFTMELNKSVNNNENEKKK